MHCFFGIFKARFENLTPSEPGITLHYPYTVYNKRQCLLLIHWILLSKLFWKTIFIIQLFQWFHNNRPRSSEYEIHILHFHSNLRSEKLEATDNSMQLKAKNPRKQNTYVVNKNTPSVHRSNAFRAAGFDANSTMPFPVDLPRSSTITTALSTGPNWENASSSNSLET